MTLVSSASAIVLVDTAQALFGFADALVDGAVARLALAVARIDPVGLASVAVGPFADPEGPARLARADDQLAAGDRRLTTRRGAVGRRGLAIGGKAALPHAAERRRNCRHARGGGRLGRLRGGRTGEKGGAGGGDREEGLRHHSLSNDLPRLLLHPG